MQKRGNMQTETLNKLQAALQQTKAIAALKQYDGQKKDINKELRKCMDLLLEVYTELEPKRKWWKRILK